MAYLQILDIENISSIVARSIVEIVNATLREKPYCVLVPSAGRTHIGTWEKLRAEYSISVNWRNVICVQMDEYHGIASGSQESFAYQINKELIEPLRIGKFITFFNNYGELNLTPIDYEQQLNALGGIDCAIHGVGRNAHIGFNEPSTTNETLGATRIVELSDDTMNSNRVNHSCGITLGIDALTNARYTIIVITGQEKQYAAASFLNRPVSPSNPVSYLRSNSNTYVYIDGNSINDEMQKAIDANALPTEFVILSQLDSMNIAKII